MALCISSCNLASSNTGIPLGAKPFGVPVFMFIVPLKAEDGTINRIDIDVDTLTQVYIDGKINETDASKRWYPIIGLENVASEKAENITETFNSGNLQIISEGVRNFTAILPGKPHEYLKQIKNFSCQKIGVYLIDNCGNLLGSERVDGYISPLRIAQNSWSTILAWATDTTGQNINLSFNFDKKERDEEMKMILSTSITADLDLIEGLVDVVLTGGVATSGLAGTATVTFDAVTFYGGAQAPIKYEALVLADFTATLEGAAETIVSVTEVDGSYTITLTSAVVASDIVTIAVSKDGISVDTITLTAV